LIRGALAFATAAALVGAALCVSCFDPVHSDEVAAQGGEQAGVPTGRFHRPGQPCLVCHGGKGPGSPEFEIAGTVYMLRDNGSDPAAGAVVVITDSSSPPNTVKMRPSNNAGNFYLEKDRETLTYPLHVEINDSRIVPDKEGSPDGGIRAMVTPIGRNGGCAFCHVNNLPNDDRATHMPRVFLNRQ
jgi:hypothetical protein